jgi:hypothetical protein
VLASTTARHGITPRTLSYTVAGVDKVYDGSAAASLKFSDDRLAGDSLSYVPNASFSDKNVGSGKAVTMTGLALSGADARNYQLGSTSATTTAAITPRTLDVIATGKIYGGTTAAVVNLPTTVSVAMRLASAATPASPARMPGYSNCSWTA